MHVYGKYVCAVENCAEETKMLYRIEMDRSRYQPWGGGGGGGGELE